MIGPADVWKWRWTSNGEAAVGALHQFLTNPCPLRLKNPNMGPQNE